MVSVEHYCGGSGVSGVVGVWQFRYQFTQGDHFHVKPADTSENFELVRGESHRAPSCPEIPDIPEILKLS